MKIIYTPSFKIIIIFLKNITCIKKMTDTNSFTGTDKFKRTVDVIEPNTNRVIQMRKIK